MGSTRRHSTVWSYIAGEKGTNRIRVYERRDRGGIWIDYRDEQGARHREPLNSLGCDEEGRQRAKTRADEIAAQFRREAKRRPSELTLSALIDSYEEEVTPSKSEGEQAHDRRTFTLFRQQFGRDRKPESLSRRDWDAYCKARRAGTLRPPNAPQRKMGARVVEHDLKLLNAVLNWGTQAGDGRGRYLLERNPLKGLPIPKEESPQRAVLTAEQYAAVLKVAAKESAMAETFVVLAWYTGHRAGSIRQLRWSDIDLERARVHFRGETDKIGHDHWNPLHAEAIAILRRARSLAEIVNNGEELGERWIFPAPRTPSRSLSRDTINKLWQRLACAAKLPTGERYGWHSLRRAFANRHRRAPLRDLQDLGGWKAPTTLLKVYLQADEDAQREVLDSQGHSLSEAPKP